MATRAELDLILRLRDQASKGLEELRRALGDTRKLSNQDLVMRLKDEASQGLRDIQRAIERAGDAADNDLIMRLRDEATGNLQQLQQALNDTRQQADEELIMRLRDEASSSLHKLKSAIGEVQSAAADDIVLRIDDAASGSLRELKDSLSDVDREASRTSSGGLADIGNVLGGWPALAATAGAAVVAAIGAIGLAAWDVASSTDQAMRKMQASLGITAEEAAGLRDDMIAAFSQGLGDNIEDAGSKMTLVRQQLSGMVDDAELVGIAIGAERIADIFGEDITKVVDASRTLMENFGVTGQEALDLITTGFQRGLNRSGDYLDTINEYGVQFRSMRATAGEFFSVLETGSQGGILGTDKAADMAKEFMLRIQDGSTLTRDSLAALQGEMAAIGAPTTELFDQLASGQLRGVEAFQAVIGMLQQVENPLIRNQLAVGLLGTQWEDLGADTALAINISQTKLQDLAGATEGLAVVTQSWGGLWERVTRQATVLLLPLGDALLNLANAAMPLVEAGFAGLATVAVPAITAIVDGITLLVGAFSTGSVDISSSVTPAFAQVGGVLNTFATTTLPFLVQSVQTMAQLFGATLGGLVGFVQANWGTISTIFSTSLQIIVAIVGAALTLLTGLFTAFLQLRTGDFRGAWETIQGMSAAFVAALIAILQGLFALLPELAALALNAVAALFGTTWTGAVTTVSTAGEAISTAVTTWLGQARDNGIAAIIGLREGIAGGLSGVYDIVAGGFAAVISYISGLPAQMVAYGLSIGAALMAGLRDGLLGALQGIIDTVAGIINDIINTINQVAEMGSPSRRTTQQGLFVGMGLETGIIASIPGIMAAARQAADAAIQPVNLAQVQVAGGAAIAPPPTTALGMTAINDEARNRSAPNVTINNPVVRQPQDVDAIARAVAGAIGRRG